MQKQTSDKHSFSTRHLVFGVVFLLLAGLAVGWLVHAYSESRKIIKTDTEPAAQLKRDDTLKPKPPTLLIKAETELLLPSRYREDPRAGFVTRLAIDHDKCLEYYGDDGILQCELLWPSLNPARAQWQIDSSIPEGEWEFDFSARHYTASYLFDMEKSTSGKIYTVTLPQELGENVAASRKNATFSLPRFQPDIQQWQFQADPENPKKNFISGEIQFDWAVDPASLEKNIAFTNVAENKDAPSSSPLKSSLGTPVFTYSPDGLTVGLVLDVLELPPTNEIINLTINPGVTRKGAAESSATVVQKATTVPGKDVFVSLSKASSLVTTDNENINRQMLLLEFTRPVKVSDIQSATKAVLLPRYEDSAHKKQDRKDGPEGSQSDEQANAQPNEQPDGQERREPADWSHFTETSKTFQKALELSRDRVLPLTPVESPTEYNTLVSFHYEIPAAYRDDVLGSGRHFYLTNAGGAASTAGYPLAPFATTVEVAPLEKELYIMQKGNILSLNASKTLAIFSRGLNTVTLNAWQVRPEYINLLMTKSYGNKGNIELDSSMLDFSDVAEKHQLTYRPTNSDPNTPDYHALDMAPFLGNGGKGLFRLELEGSGLTDEGKQGNAETYQSTFLLITDLALNVKKNDHGERQIFINSFASGQPCEGVKLEIIGRNGLPVFSALSDESGQVFVPDIDGFKEEKEAVAFVATLGEDYTVLPIESYDRRVYYSDFPSTEGRHTAKGGLDAFVFSERGIYRPGEELRFGAIVKNSEWDNSQIEGLPLRVELFNPRLETIYKKTYVQNPSGLVSIPIPTQETDPTGRYELSIFLDNIWLGNASVQVEEFLPETLRLETSFNKIPPTGLKGWVVPEDLKLTATVSNLYGTPAIGNTVKFHYRLTPVQMAFSEYDGYRFFDPGTNTRQYWGDVRSAETNEQGEAEFVIDSKEYVSGSYSLLATTEAFEQGSGRSVTKYDTIRISPHSILVGWKSDADVRYIPHESEATVNFIAIDNTLALASLDHLELLISEVNYISSLVKTDEGNYRYENVRRLTALQTESVAIDASGFNFILPTDKTGEFEVSLKNRAGLEICNLSYVVAGGSQRIYGLERDVNLRIHLDRSEYSGGDEIEIFISAPYAGTGLITIESDKIHASKWFTADTSDSVQRITVPDSVEGRTFVNVALVRNIHSEAVHSTPFVYAVAPFMGNLERRDQRLTLEAPKEIAPGDTMTMRLTAEKPGKALVFAVDEGILQLTSHKPPSPLTYFLKQNSLSVTTMQNWDLIMPEYYLMHSAFGGDLAAPMAGDEDFLNPFRRKAEASVVYWSGLVDVDREGTTLEWEVPSYFNGSLRIMAVSAGAASVGEASRNSLVRGPLAIFPNLPVAVAPGDEFEVAAVVANNIEGSGENVAVQLEVQLDEGLAFIREPETTLSIDELRQGLTDFRLKAIDRLGESTVTFIAKATFGDKEVIVKRPISLSVRPASPKISAFKAGVIKGNEQTVPIGRTLYPEYAQVKASVSGLPLPMVDALSDFLTTFPHGCTEQILSAAFPYAVLNKSPELLPVPKDMTPADLKEQSEKAVQRGLSALREREILPGRFTLWPYESSYGYSYLTVYGLDYMITAKEAGFKVSQDLIDNAQRETLRILQGTPSNHEAMYIMVYAAWVYTRSGKTLTELPRLVKNLDANIKDWRQSPSAALLAACYQMMQQDKEADQLLKSAKAIDPDKNEGTQYSGWFTSRLWENSLLLTAYAETFPDRLDSREAQKALVYVINDVMGGIYTTSSAAQATRAITAYAMGNMTQTPAIILEAKDAKGQTIASEATGTYVKRLVTAPGDVTGDITGDATPSPLAALNTHAFHFGGAKGLYWQITTNGFDREPLPPLSKKLLVSAEYIPVDDKPLSELVQGDEVYVLLRAKATEAIDNVAITALIPGGFEMVISKGGALMGEGDNSQVGNSMDWQRRLHQGKSAPLDIDGPTSYPNRSQVAAVRNMLDEAEIYGQAMPLVHAERREDRMVVFTSLSPSETLFIYRIKAINKGVFTLPAMSAAALYDPDARANTKQGTIEVK